MPGTNTALMATLFMVRQDTPRDRPLYQISSGRETLINGFTAGTVNDNKI